MKKSHNPLLVHAEIGKAKPPVVNLPPEGFVYGQKSYSIEGDNAKNGQSRFNFLDAAVLTKWVEHAPNDASRPGKDFKRANKFSVKAGVTTAKLQSEFRKEHDIRMKYADKISAEAAPLPVDPTKFRFGRKSKGSTPMCDLITNRFQNEFLHSQEVRHTEILEEKRARPIHHTRASLGHQFVDAVDEEKPVFKMKRFENVPARTVVPK